MLASSPQHRSHAFLFVCRGKELLLGQLLLLYTAETWLVIILCFQINFFFRE